MVDEVVDGNTRRKAGGREGCKKLAGAVFYNHARESSSVWLGGITTILRQEHSQSPGTRRKRAGHMMETIVALCLLAMMLVSMDIGYRIGHTRKSSDAQTSIEVIGTVDAAIFGLLGLILAFTFSGAADRLVVRRAQIVQEANAIGTAYLRIDVLSQSEQPAIRELFRAYLEKRIEVFDKFTDRAASNVALEKAEQLQRNIWSRSVASCRADPKPDACLLMLPALNEMIDITTTRNMATRTHAPSVILILLILLSLAAAMLSGYAMSRQPKRSIMHMLLFSLVVSASVYVVLDLEYPRAGVINLRSMDQALYQLRETMK
jgi:ABC-type glycerol-3-phosphate transport system permease component